jgi:type IV pilus assembly protein PilB
VAAGLPVQEAELEELLVSRLGVIDETEFARARDLAHRLRIPLERTLVERGRVPYKFLLEQIAESWEIPFVELRLSDVDPAALRTLPADYAKAQAVVPFAIEGRELRIAMRDPRDRRVIDEIERRTGLRVTPRFCQETAIRRALLLYSAELREMLAHASTPGAAALRPDIKGQEEQVAVAMVTRIFQYAAAARASDIHVEPFELELLVRCRIDGVLREVLSLPPTATASVTARMKVMAKLRLDERRVPQDGRIQLDLDGLPLDLRVSTLPTLWGEKIVMRVLAGESLPPDLEDLGLSSSDYEVFLRNVLRPWGMILVTGPTGSGKTTTLFAALSRVAAERQSLVNISTIEDPVEYTMPRVNQMPTNEAAGVGFAEGLRALLRQDPDVIMVGEMRDRETAEIGIRAALVGRLLLSTLHTNDSTGTVPRLLDMGVEPYLVASTLALVVGQRLVRRICVNCRESVELDAKFVRSLRARKDYPATVQVLQRLGVLGNGTDPLAGARAFRGRGCAQCLGSGFRGRLGLFELFEVDETLREMIMTRTSGAHIRAAALASGMKTMFQDGLAKALLGETTVEEVLRVAM